jgi:hypothetical protein
MKKHSHVLWLTVLALGWLFDFLFWKQAAGSNFAIYAVLCLVAGFLLLRLDRDQIARGALWLIPLIVIFAALTLLRAEPLTLLLGVFFTLFLMAVLSMTFLGGRWLEYGIADYAVGLFRLIGSVIARPLAFRSEVRRAQRESGEVRAGPNPWPVVRGILLALPVVVIFAALLASADLVFGRELDALLKVLRLEDLPQYVFRLVYVLLAAYALAGVFLHAASQSRDVRLVGEGQPPFARVLGFVEAVIVLGSVIVLFGAFVIVQFRYFFGGQANINLAGFTYSEYARRGFGELMAVAFFSLLMILGLGMVTRRDTEMQQRLFSGLSVVLLALVSVMLVSAYQRLGLYELAYGFSRLRTYVHVLLLWLGLLLAAVVLLEIVRRERLFVIAALIASMGFALTISVLNVDGFIVRQNVDRSIRGQRLDVQYLVSLSTDAVPDLVAIYESSAYPSATRDAVGAVLACRLQESSARSSAGWRSFTVSRWLAETSAQAVHSQLSGYRISDASWPVTILTPAGLVEECYGSTN